MRIKELSGKYNIDTRTIDYYSRLGILPFKEESDHNTYRNYDEESERILKRIMILREVGYSINEIKEMTHSQVAFSTNRIKYYASRLNQRREEEIDRINKLIEYTNDVLYSVKDLKGV